MDKNDKRYFFIRPGTVKTVQSPDFAPAGRGKSHQAPIRKPIPRILLLLLHAVIDLYTMFAVLMP